MIEPHPFKLDPILSGEPGPLFKEGSIAGRDRYCEAGMHWHYVPSNRNNMVRVDIPPEIIIVLASG
jgi:hypothetical protein